MFIAFLCDSQFISDILS